MTAQEIIATVATMPQSDWIKIQCGIAELITAQFSPDDVKDIHEALAQSEAEFARGEGLSSREVRLQLGLQ